VIEHRGEARFSQKHFRPASVSRRIREETFQGHDASIRGVASTFRSGVNLERGFDRPHSAAPENEEGAVP
jgi:hypothetical protein